MSCREDEAGDWERAVPPLLTLRDRVDVVVVKADPAPVSAAPSSILMSFPWRELGGGGFFLPPGVIDAACSCKIPADEERGDDGSAALRLLCCRSSNSSGSEISWDVLGVSGGMASKMDCRDTELASVLLEPSWTGSGGCRDECEGAAVAVAVVAW